MTQLKMLMKQTDLESDLIKGTDPIFKSVILATEW